MSELRNLEARIKSLEDWQQAIARTCIAAPTPQPKPTDKTVDDIRKIFPEELEKRLSFNEDGPYIVVTFKEFLGSETFAKIASAIRGIGGEYISAGKDSRFRVPKKAHPR